MAENEENDFGIPNTVLDRVPTRQELLKVSKDVGADNYVLGISLGLDQPKIEQIKCEYRDVQSQTLNILMTWLNTGGHSVTVRELCTALNDITFDKSKIPEIFR